MRQDTRAWTSVEARKRPRRENVPAVTSTARYTQRAARRIRANATHWGNKFGTSDEAYVSFEDHQVRKAYECMVGAVHMTYAFGGGRVMSYTGHAPDPVVRW